jgi:hypothetical protein
MKKYILTSLMTIGVVAYIQAQTFNNTKIDELKVKFIELEIITEKGVLQKFHIDFGVGDKSVFFKTKIKDNNGAELIFKTPMKLINYLTSIGFELIETNVTALSTSSRRIYLLENTNL